MHIHQIFVRQGFSLAWNLSSRLGWLSKKPHRSASLYLSSNGITHTSTCHALFVLNVGSEDWTQVPLLAGQTLYHINWAIFLNPSTWIFTLILTVTLPEVYHRLQLSFSAVETLTFDSCIKNELRLYPNPWWSKLLPSNNNGFKSLPITLLHLILGHPPHSLWSVCYFFST